VLLRVISNPVLRKTWLRGMEGLIPHVNVLGVAAALAAYRDGEEWLTQCLAYLEGNRELVERSLDEGLPYLSMSRMEATYLAWIDCRGSGIPGNPFRFFLEKGRVALNDGLEYEKGEGVCQAQL
jgi:cystathionine beta-lyase